MAAGTLADSIETTLRTYPSVSRVRRIDVRAANGRKKVKISPNGESVDFIVTEPDNPRVTVRANTSNAASVVANMRLYFERNQINVQ